jgi:hypothetical protein
MSSSYPDPLGIPSLWHEPVLPLANQVFELVKKGRLNAAKDLLQDAGYSNAQEQVQDIAGFITYMKYFKGIRW